MELISTRFMKLGKLGSFSKDIRTVKQIYFKASNTENHRKLIK